MANTWVIPVGYDLSVDEMNVGDGLFLVFCSQRKFCVHSNSPDIFPNNPFPSGDQEPGTIWPPNGSPAIAQSTGTITFTSREHGEDCPSAPDHDPANTMGNHSIQVGSS